MHEHKRWIAGVALILMGLLLLAASFFAQGLWVLLGLGALFIAWGLAVREPGLLIPGGVLLGVGGGIWMTQWPAVAGNDRLEGAVFMLAFGAGWCLISLLAAALGCRMLWPLIPGGVFFAIGLPLLVGGAALTALAWAGKLWPLIFVALGVYILWKQHASPDSREDA